MEFRTKREAEEAAHAAERRANVARSDADTFAFMGAPSMASDRREVAVTFDAEAARVRALLPALPEEASFHCIAQPRCGRQCGVCRHAAPPE